MFQKKVEAVTTNNAHLKYEFAKVTDFKSRLALRRLCTDEDHSDLNWLLLNTAVAEDLTIMQCADLLDNATRNSDTYDALWERMDELHAPSRLCTY
jgi:hypothetical protein